VVTRKLKGAIAIGGRVYRAGQEEALAKAAAAAGVDLTDPRFDAAFGGPLDAAARAAGTRVTRTPSASERLKTAEDVQAAYTTRDAERYLAKITDPAEVKRLAKLDTRKSLKTAYADRLKALE